MTGQKPTVTREAARRFLVARHLLAPPRSLQSGPDAVMEVFRRLGGEVDVRIYPDLGHEVNDDEIDEVREMMSALVRRGQAGGRPSR